MEASAGGTGPAADQLPLLGERLCLNFANTIDPRHSDHPREYLTSYQDLVAWSRRAAAIKEAEVRGLLGQAARDPHAAETVFQQARRLREALYDVFAAIAAGQQPGADPFSVLNEALSSAMARARIEAFEGGYRWGWQEDPRALDRMLWPVVRSAAELLTTGQRNRIRECPGSDGCGWVLYDTSKHGSRRWCSMEGCGNRAKGRRHYQRVRGAATASSVAPRGARSGPRLTVAD